MRKYIIILLSAAGLMGMFYAYSVSNAEQDDLDVALHEINFLRLKPASKLHTVGALYFIGWWDISNVTPICSPPKEILAKYIHHSKSEDMGGSRILQGTYTSHIKANADQAINGKGSLDDKRFITVHYELINVNIDEIELGPSSEVYDQLMQTQSCSDMVTRYLKSGYICQDLELLKASALFKRDSDSETGAKLDMNTEKALAAEIDAAMGVHVTDNEGRSEAGEGLEWGIQMTPLCLTPLDAWFQRALPRNNFDKVVNFIKFNILERVLPAPRTS
jgi:hypothetical protein